MQSIAVPTAVLLLHEGDAISLRIASEETVLAKGIASKREHIHAQRRDGHIVTKSDTEFRYAITIEKALRGRFISVSQLEEHCFFLLNLRFSSVVHKVFSVDYQFDFGFLETTSLGNNVRWLCDIRLGRYRRAGIYNLWDKARPLVGRGEWDRLLIIGIDVLSEDERSAFQDLSLVHYITLEDLEHSKNPLGTAASGQARSSAVLEYPGDQVIRQHLTQRPDGTAAMALTLAFMVTTHIEGLQARTPNEPAALAAQEEYIDFLKTLAARLDELGRVLSSPQEAAVTHATDIVRCLANSVEAWLKGRGKDVLNDAYSVGALGAGTAFLAWCGAPNLAAFTSTAAILSGKTLWDGVRLWLGRPQEAEEQEAPASKKHTRRSASEPGKDPPPTTRTSRGPRGRS